MGPGYTLATFAPPLSIHFLIFCSLLLFPFLLSTPDLFVSDIAIFVLKGDVKLQLTNW